MTTCTGVTKDGRPCTAQALKGSSLCFTHNPKSREAKQAAVKKGGINSLRRSRALRPSIRLERPEDIMHMVEEAANAVRYEKMTPKEAGILGYLGNVWLKAFQESQEGKKADIIDATLKLDAL